MGVFKSLREKNSVIRFLVNAQKTPWYPALFALLCIISGTHNHTVYIPMLWVLTAFLLFSVLFADDNKVFLTPLMMIYFALGCDTSSDAFLTSNGEMLSFMDKHVLVQIVIICTVCVGSLVTRLVMDGSLAAALKKRRFFTLSILVIDAALLLNGIFGPVYQPVNLGLGALIAAGFTVVYLLACGIVENSDDPKTYACYAMLGASYVALLQMMRVVVEKYKSGDLIINYKLEGIVVVNKDILTLGWGISTVVGAVIALGVPAAMYLAKNRKGSLFTYFSAPLLILGTAIINCRSAMIISILAFVVCTVVCWFSGKNRVLIRIYSAVLIAAAAGACLYINFSVTPLAPLFDEIIELLRLDADGSIIGSRRTELWKNGFEDFFSAPIFGVGFNDGGYPPELQSENLFSNMYHCILIQIPAAMGIIGCFAFVFHGVRFAWLCIKRFSVDKLLLLMVPLMIVGMSLVDNFFFYMNFQIFYGIFLVMAEKTLNETK